MSIFLGGDSGQSGVEQFRANDDRLNPQWWDRDDWREMPRDSAWNLVVFNSPYWPGGSGLDASGGDMLSAVWFSQPEITSGASGFYGLTGITRDVYGTAVGGCDVHLFLTETNVLVSNVTSDDSGFFMVPTPYYPNAHYIVAHKTGTPNIAGATVPTLVAG